MNFILNLIERHIKPQIDSKKLKDTYNYIDLKDLYSEIKAFLISYLNSFFNHGKSANNQIKPFLDQILLN